MITIKDVAREAGVSIATVSRVLNSPEKVSEMTRKNVLKVVHKTGFKLSPSPRKQGWFKTVGLIAPNLMGNFYGEIAMGIEKVLFDHRFDLLVAMARDIQKREKQIIEEYFQRKVDGLLVCTMLTEEHILDRLIDSGIPVVAVDHRVGDIKADSVNIDNVSAAFSVAKFLYERGHRKVLCIPGQDYVYSSLDRIKGLQFFAQAHKDITFHFTRIRGFEPQYGYDALHAYLKHNPLDFSAIFGFNDHICMGVFSALKELGVSVPGQVSVMGFDDSVFAPYTVPGLTTVSQPRVEMGRLAAELLLERLSRKGPKIFRNVLLPTQIVERESVGFVGGK
ncbi:MAG TPA: LacI family DNA-binding transcriptional regulator [Thermotogota bacterium]|nr:LacI family DNA-binding transcriptional regulator [Thermotogota bacterium]HRW93637.1 LacI family DNA-binding transcriptional regulator [Thermotogota bacterium]